MFNQTDVNQLFLSQSFSLIAWRQLLLDNGIERVFVKPDVDKTLGLFANDNLVATVSHQGNVIKYIVISEEYKDNGRTFNLLVSSIIQEMSQQGIFHYCVITKEKYKKSFEYLGFQTISETPMMTFLESGEQSIEKYLQAIPVAYGAHIAGIVMNANPFTNGHYALVEQAAKENNWVYVFVLGNDQELFTAKERLKLVLKGTASFCNVTVVSGEDYVISPSTFPAYFFRKDTVVAKEQMLLDAYIFKQRIAPKLKITKRYLGEEPFSQMTATYNNVLQKNLPPKIDVMIVPRKEDEEHRIISASRVRTAYLDGKIESIKAMVPETTYEFLLNKPITGSVINGN